VRCPVGRCLVDTCSDVSVARRDILLGPYRVRDAVVVGHLRGESRLNEAGTLEIGRVADAPPVLLAGVYLVEPEMLPAGRCAPRSG
jgi:hypothetical protein